MSLLHHCQRIEQQMGRTHKGMLKPRTADIDILLYGEEVVSARELVIPHPALLNRRFCLEGLAEVAPKMRHPVAGRTFEELLDHMPDNVARQAIRFRDPLDERRVIRDGKEV
jgi:2-amino-4-hydroxy-6-hydroxymethyldihydropteridine diphosphokinase